MTTPSHSETQDGRLKVTDLALATCLLISGFEAELVNDGRTGRKRLRGAWLFAKTPDVETTIERFHSGAWRVEPRTFRQGLTSTRQEMFDFLGIARPASE